MWASLPMRCHAHVCAWPACCYASACAWDTPLLTGSWRWWTSSSGTTPDLHRAGAQYQQHRCVRGDVIQSCFTAKTWLQKKDFVFDVISFLLFYAFNYWCWCGGWSICQGCYWGQWRLEDWDSISQKEVMHQAHIPATVTNMAASYTICCCCMLWELYHQLVFHCIVGAGPIGCVKNQFFCQINSPKLVRDVNI